MTCVTLGHQLMLVPDVDMAYVETIKSGVIRVDVTGGDIHAIRLVLRQNVTVGVVCVVYHDVNGKITEHLL